MKESSGSFIELTISQGGITFDDGFERLSDLGSHIKVVMSPAQFAELITSVGVGVGVPCTVRKIGKERIPDPPDEPSETDRIKSEFRNRLEALIDLAKKNQSEVAKVFEEKKNISQGDRNFILKIIGKMILEMEDGLPFILNWFVESTDKISRNARMEVETFIASFSMTEGMKAMMTKKD